MGEEGFFRAFHGHCHFPVRIPSKGRLPWIKTQATCQVPDAATREKLGRNSTRQRLVMFNQTKHSERQNVDVRQCTFMISYTCHSSRVHIELGRVLQLM